MRLTPLSDREVIRRLSALGYKGPKGKGKHRHMEHPETRLRISILSTSKDVKVGTIRGMIRRAGITREIWNSL